MQAKKKIRSFCRIRKRDRRQIDELSSIQICMNVRPVRDCDRYRLKKQKCFSVPNSRSTDKSQHLFQTAYTVRVTKEKKIWRDNPTSLSALSPIFLLSLSLHRPGIREFAICQNKLMLRKAERIRIQRRRRRRRSEKRRRAL